MQCHLRLVALILLAASSDGCSNGSIKLDYFISPCADASNALEIRLHLDGLPSQGFVLRGYAPAQHMRISELRVVTPDGSEISTRERFLDVARRRRTFEVPRYEVEGQVSSSLTVTYRVSPGSLEGDTHGEGRLTSYGHLGTEGAVLRGRHLFMVPEMERPPRQISVRFSDRMPGEVHAPWVLAKGRYRPDLSLPDRGLEALVTATIAFGRFNTRSVFIGGTEFEFDLAAEIEPDDYAGIVDPMLAVLRGTHRVFPEAFGKRYSVIVAAPLASGAELANEGWLLGQGGSFAPLTHERLLGFARNVWASALRDRPTPIGAAPPSLSWVRDGASEWYAWKSVVAAENREAKEVANYLLLAYVQHLGQASTTINLETAYESSPPTLFVRRVVAPLIYAAISDEVRREGPVPGDPDYLLHALVYAREPLTPDTLLEPIPEPRRTELRASLIQSRGDRFLERFDLLSTPRPAPHRECGAGAERLTVIYTGNTEGYLENCGCKMNESGGIARRATVLRRLRLENRPALVIDAGNFRQNRPVSRSDANDLAIQEEVFYQKFMEGEGYDLVFASTNELIARRAPEAGLTGGEISALLTPVTRECPPPREPSMQIVRVGNLSVAGIALVDTRPISTRVPAFGSWADSNQLPDPVARLGELLAGLPGEVDLVVVGGNLSPSTIRAIAAAYPRVDIVVSTDESVEPLVADRHGARRYSASDEQGFVGGTLVLYPELSKYGVNHATVTLDRSHRICSAQFHATLLDDDIQDDPATRARLETFYRSVERERSIVTLRAPALPVTTEARTRRYVGHETCAPCHAREHAQWASTAHATAYKTLLDRHRHFHPGCVGCHVVGYGEPGGFDRVRPTEGLANVQCEACHGPGAEHAAAPSKANVRRQVEENVCLRCHDQAHSDYFDYETRLPLVAHGSDQPVGTKGVEPSREGSGLR